MGNRVRLKQATEPGAAIPTFASCIADRESQPKCRQTYDATNSAQQREFKQRLQKALAAMACDDADIARGIFRQIPDSDVESNSTRAGLATVLLARMKKNPPCTSLAGLSAEDKKKLEELAKREAERQRAAKAASAVRQ